MADSTPKTPPLVSLDERRARGMASMARTIAAAAGRPARLVRWSNPEVLQEVSRHGG